MKGKAADFHKSGLARLVWMRLSHSSLSREGVPGISVSLDRFSVLLMYTLQQSVQLVTLVEVQA